MDVVQLKLIFLTILVTVNVAMAIWYFVGQFRKRSHIRKCASSDEFVEFLHNRVDTLEGQNETLQGIVGDLRTMHTDIEGKYNVISAANLHSPIPMWVKDIHGIILDVNLAFEKAFLEPNGRTRDDYIGGTEYDMWDDDIAYQFRSHDVYVISQEKSMNITEVARVNGEEQEYRTFKYPYYVNNKLVGVAGCAIPPPGEELPTFVDPDRKPSEFDEIS